MQQRQW